MDGERLGALDPMGGSNVAALARLLSHWMSSSSSEVHLYTYTSFPSSSCSYQAWSREDYGLLATPYHTTAGRTGECRGSRGMSPARSVLRFARPIGDFWISMRRRINRTFTCDPTMALLRCV